MTLAICERGMGVFDLLIVYLAFAAPFAVSEYLHRHDLARALGVFAFWPLSAWRLVSRQLGARKNAGRAFDERTSRIFAKLQRELSDDGAQALEFRDVFDRYVGLTLEANHDELPSDTKSAELFRISGRENSRTASATIGRRNAARLRRHHTDARTRFLELIERSHEFNALVLALELATSLGDEETANYLNRAIGHDRTEGELWNTQNEQESKQQIAA